MTDLKSGSRKLASIQTISALAPIPGADKIEQAKVLGWYLVVPKDAYKVGDPIVYVEVDSLLPEAEPFEFLRKNSFRPAYLGGDNQVLQRAGFRICTVMMRGQVSQGICFPLSILPEGAPTEVGSEVTELLGIIKHDPPLPSCLDGKAIGYIPSFLSKTDETRVQTLENVVARHQGKKFYATEKIDGSSVTVYAYEGKTGICGRTLEFDDTDYEGNTIVRTSRHLMLQKKLLAASTESGVGWAIQGEIIGPGIQGNKYGLKETTILAFNVLKIVNGLSELVSYKKFQHVTGIMGIPTVPELGDFILNHSIDDLVEMSKGPSVLDKNVQREGIVLRPIDPEMDPEIGRLSFKVINPEFLLKYGE